jgi:uncharacterized protein (UPF0335 family)
MAKRSKKQTVDIGQLQPDEINALRATVKEFMDRMQNIENEISTLKDDRKALVEEYADKLDIRTLNAALKVTKIQSEVEHRDCFDLFIEALTTV